MEYFWIKIIQTVQTVSLRNEDKCPKGEGYPEQTIPLAHMREARQPQSTMLSAASQVRAINVIIKNHAHSFTFCTIRTNTHKTTNMHK